MNRAATALAPLAAVAALLTGCAGRGTPETADPVAAAAAVTETAPDRPLRIIFGWRMMDGDARFSGDGAARVEPPYRARLDLFGPRGEAYLSAALVDADVRLPPGTAAVPLPPAAMMWAVLGVVAPPDGAVLAGTRVEEDRTELHYAVAGTRLVYTLQRGRLRSADWNGEGRRMAVELSGAVEPGLPAEAVYRDWAGYTELMLTLEEVEEVEPYPPETWNPGA